MDDMKRKRIIHISTKNLQSTDCSIMPFGSLQAPTISHCGFCSMLVRKHPHVFLRFRWWRYLLCTPVSSSRRPGNNGEPAQGAQCTDDQM